eukprot:s141_g2.t1
MQKQVNQWLQEFRSEAEMKLQEANLDRQPTMGQLSQEDPSLSEALLLQFDKSPGILLKLCFNCDRPAPDLTHCRSHGISVASRGQDLVRGRS